MRPLARARALAALVAAWAMTATDASTEYGIPIEIKLWDTGRTPLSHMVDVTNEFGLKVLAEHNFLNDNNIAFSPYGLMGILVALYEGVEGESSFQIQRALQLPWNRNVMRIGFRDIHRTLKTYFVPEEGFLAGLALNNENVTFNDSYRKILRFYGFHLENDQIPSLPANNNTNESPPLSSAGPAEESTAREEPATTPSRADSTTNPNAETFVDIDLRVPSTEPTNGISSSAPNTGDTTESGAVTTFATPASALIALSGAVAAEDSSGRETAIDTLSTMLETTTRAMTPDSTDTTTPALYDTAPNEDTETRPVTQGSTTTSTSEIASTEQISTEITNLPSMVSNAMVSETRESTITSDTPFLNDVSTLENMDSIDKITDRRKKSIVNFIFTRPFNIDDDLMNRGFDIPVPVFDDQRTPERDQTFLANGMKNVQVSYMQYDSVLEHAFLPHLQAAALRLPLDSARHYLLALLPARAHGLPRLLARLARRSDLRDVYAAMRPTRVRAVLPTFTVKGHVILTADLQKLGIRSVFEPRQRDFAPMTGARGVHVRSVEQAVSVALRKYAPDDRNSTRFVDQHPVHFSATYPFLYFVMDASIHVALMAGKMVDPLNCRIL